MAVNQNMKLYNIAVFTVLALFSSLTTVLAFQPHQSGSFANSAIKKASNCGSSRISGKQDACEPLFMWERDNIFEMDPEGDGVEAYKAKLAKEGISLSQKPEVRKYTLIEVIVRIFYYSVSIMIVNDIFDPFFQFYMGVRVVQPFPFSFGG
mmetsp:Transcript_52660/g.61469  ORF Transcript_52660/g.61469 Transcript_52660/m.61469 type:complete len:151 (-) Transcript_52660:393-845(-)